MSQTFNIACMGCKRSLWIGQGWQENFYIYTEPKEQIKGFAAFLMAHLGHQLEFGDGQDWEGFEEIEIEDESPTPGSEK